MNTNRDRLDESIDHVASRMTRVEQNDAFASQIINALPERVTWFGWLTHSWAPRLAMIAVVIAAGILWSNRGSHESSSGPSPIAGQPIAAFTPLVASVREAAPNRTMPLERVERLEPMELSNVDFDRSLPAIVAMNALQLDSLAPVSLPEDAALTLLPLAIEDLPLTAETISPR
jgi:hypothetical protein